ncbi:MAG: hypothetical protein EXX96DRAFT_140394 [Benjaminiella poitrasii]|nr:MAG: hypothetical protein EXX96DRAFT_140394 [Benjaminiella poitrasii]
MFSKSSSVINYHHDNLIIRPYWFTASIKPARDDSLTLITVVELRDLNHLIKLAELYQSSISATLLVPSENIHDEYAIQQLTKVRQMYETTVALRRHVDIHLVLQPSIQSLSENATFTGGYQEARNLARLFSRTDYIALVPVSILWMTDIQRSFRHHLHLLQEGHLLIIPTFGFPYYNVDDEIDHDTLPRDKQTTVEWVEEGKMGLLDYHYELNNGPTSYSTWKEAREPYIVPTYDYQYGPIFISSKTNHPWCEERFEDNMASCLYTTYLAGADLWILPNDYVIRTGHEPADTLYTPQQRKIHNRLAKRYRMEQCVFYARQFDQYGTFDKAHHVKQECSKALLSLQKEKMISGYLTE